MLKKGLSFFISILLIVSLFPISVFAVVEPQIYKDEITVKVGETAKVDFTYGDSASKVECNCSNLCIDYVMSDNTFLVTGVSEGESYLTALFNDGTLDKIKINVVSRNSYVYDKTNMEVKTQDTKNIYIDLVAYGAKSATFLYDNSVISVNKQSITTSGILKITGRKLGSSVLKVEYNTGDSEVYHIDVVSSYSVSSDSEHLSLNVNESLNYHIDLRKYDATKATIRYNSSYIKVSQSTFYSSGNLTITAYKRGTSDIKVEYNTGDIETLEVYCEYNINNRDSSVSVDYLEVEKDNIVSFYVYLGNSAESVSLKSEENSGTLSSNKLYVSSRVNYRATKVGRDNIKVEFDDGTVVYIPVIIGESNYIKGEAELSKDTLSVGEVASLSLYMGTNNKSVTITVDNPEKMDLNILGYTKNKKTYTLNYAQNSTVEIKIMAKDLVNNSYITVKYPEGKTYKFILSIVDVEKVEGKDRVGNSFVLHKNISINKKVLSNGYIEGYNSYTFGPLNNITRQEFAVILARILDFKGAITSSDYLPDVTAEWSKDSVGELVAMGVIDKDSLFRPTDYITRYEVVEMLYNVIDLKGYSTSCPLTDVNIMTVAGEKIAKCYNAGVVEGYSDRTFSGSNNITRTEAVVLINRLFYKDKVTDKVNKFSDVSVGFWGYSDIVKATVLGG